jgi:hypothetical protein
VLRHRRLGDGELLPDGETDVTRRHLTVGEQFEYAATHRISENVERMHCPKIKLRLI